MVSRKESVRDKWSVGCEVGDDCFCAALNSDPKSWFFDHAIVTRGIWVVLPRKIGTFPAVNIEAQIDLVLIVCRSMNGHGIPALLLGPYKVDPSTRTSDIFVQNVGLVFLANVGQEVARQWNWLGEQFVKVGDMYKGLKVVVDDCLGDGQH